jgi:two-component system chemotaxis response regulator CheV
MATNILLESGTNELEILEFIVGGNRYGINVAKIEQIIGDCEIKEVPNTKPFVEGIFRRRGKIYTVINLADFLGLEAHHTKDIFLITYFNQTYAAFRVDEIRMIHHLSWTDIQEPDQILSDDNNGIITGIAKLDNNEMILILDFEKMLFDINPETGIDERKVEHVDRSKHEDTPILIAEDSTLLRKMIVECLAKAGFTRINACINGQEAWDHLQHFRENGELNDKVQCIITDIEMPKMDGLTLTRKIKEDRAMQSIPVIVFSSMIDDATSQKCTQVGANAQLSKPDIVRLVSTIDEMMTE